MSQAYTVVVIIEAKPEMASKLKKELLNVVGPCRAENNCLEYRLHQDLNNPAQFVIYETWKSQEKHELQFQKPYIISLINNLENVLAKPYQIVCAEEMAIVS